MVDVMRKKRIGELLVWAGLITRVQLSSALAEQEARGGRLVSVLMALGYMNPECFARLLAREGGIPSVDLERYEVPERVLALVPREFALQHEVFPLDRMKNLLTVAMVCPLDGHALCELERLTGLQPRPLLCTAREHRAAVERCYPVRRQTQGEYVESLKERGPKSRGGRRGRRQAEMLEDDAATNAASADDAMSFLPRSVSAGGRSVGAPRQDASRILAEIRERQGLHRVLLAEIDEELAALQGLLQCDAEMPSAEPSSPFGYIHREVCGLLKERRLEKAACWRDVSVLRRELRELTHECQQARGACDASLSVTVC